MSDDPKALAGEVMSGGRRALAKAITLLESKRPDQRPLAEALLALLAPKAGKSLRVGISGPPGVGKSTFIEALGRHLTSKGHRVAVLAVDPSSPLSGGSILGDRVRMEELSKDPKVFIRPSPSGATLGGVARHTRETILACEAAGHDVVLVETVGVGQSETVVASMVDAFLMLYLPNSGDEIQGMKRGILELADLVAVTKADGNLAKDAATAKGQLELALHLSRGGSTWIPPVLTISSIEARGVTELWQAILDFAAQQKTSKAFDGRRADQAVAWFRGELTELLQDRLRSRPDQAAALAKTEEEVRAGRLAASLAAARVIDGLLS